MNYKTFFLGKKIAIVGLGHHGEMISDIRFLLRNGADLTLYDMRSEARLHGFIKTLKEIGLVNYNLGKINADELSKAELIILSAEISRNSVFLKMAQRAGVQIEYPELLFLKMSPAITIIGVIGVYGKSTVAHMLYEMLKKSFKDYEGQGLCFIDPDLPNGALTRLKKIKPGDVVLARIPEERLGEYHFARISPHVAVITSLVPFGILEYQTYNNFIVAPNIVVDSIRLQNSFNQKAKILRTRSENSTLACETATLFKVSHDTAQRVIDDFSGLRGRRELIKKVNGIEFYNDATSVHPLSTLFALQSLSINRNITLIFGGAYTGRDYSELIKNIPQYVSTAILLPGSGTIGFRADVEALKDIILLHAHTLEEAVILAREHAKKGDRVLFSPGCEAIGIHISRKERGEKFVKAVRAL